ncbi:MAG: RNA polymerase sigma factor [Nannocystaceae bacterium]|nr:sigma-70 family RNA polymerase sigma factor [bacterium]
MADRRTDVELLQAWRGGDLGAGDELFNRHFTSVHRFFRNKVREEALEDLVQQTFMASVEGRERFRSDSTFRTYLFGVANNLLRDHYRKQRKAEVLDFGETSVQDARVGPNTLLGRRQEQRLLLEALRRIPIDSQIVLELYYWEELSASQTAAVLGIPEGTVRGRVRKAKALLKKKLTVLARSAADLESTAANLEGWAASLRELLADAPPKA